MKKFVKVLLVFITVFIVLLYGSVSGVALKVFDSGTQLSYLNEYYLNGCPRLTIHFSTPHLFTDTYNNSVYDFDTIIYILPNFYHVENNIAYYTCHRVDPTNSNYHTASYGSSLHSSDYQWCDTSGTVLDSMISALYFTPSGLDSSVTGSDFQVLAYVGYTSSGQYYRSAGTHPSGMRLNSINNLYPIRADSLINSSYSPSFVSSYGYIRSGTKNFELPLQESYYFHGTDSISFETNSGYTFEDDDFVTSDECGCQNCCECDCGYYTEELKEELIEYFDQNFITQEMFNSFVSNYFGDTTNNYYQDNQSNIYNDYSIIQSQQDNTEFSSNIGNINDNQGTLYSEIHEYADSIESFNNQLTISPEVSEAIGMVNSVFSAFPLPVIAALVFCLVMLVVVKILGR